MSGLIWEGSPIRAVLFDFDGTLVSLEIDFDLMRNNVAEAINRYAINESDLMENFIVERITEARKILEQDDVENALAMEREAFTAIEDIEIEAASKAIVHEGVWELFSQLHSLGVSIGIVTRNSERSVTSTLQGRPLPYDMLVSRDHTPHLKPDPRHLLAALQAMDVPPTAAIMVGDHPTDISAAVNLSVIGIGILNGRNNESELMEAGATQVVGTILELARLLEIDTSEK